MVGANTSRHFLIIKIGIDQMCTFLKTMDINSFPMFSTDVALRWDITKKNNFIIFRAWNSTHILQTLGIALSENLMTCFICLSLSDSTWVFNGEQNLILPWSTSWCCLCFFIYVVCCFRCRHLALPLIQFTLYFIAM